MKEKRKESIIMPAKKKHPVRLEELTPDEKVKYEIAEELGLLDRVMQDGWKSLTSKETGKYQNRFLYNQLDKTGKIIYDKL